MSLTSKQEYIIEVRKRYCGASKTEKQRILNEVCATCGYHRKYALRSIEAALPFRMKGFDADNGSEFLNGISINQIMQ